MAGQSRKRDTYDRWCAHGRLLACGAAARLPSPSPRGCQRALARLKGPRRVLSLPYKAAIAVLPVALGKCGVENSNVTVAHGIFCSALVIHQRAFQDLNNVLGLRSPLGPNFNIYHTFDQDVPDAYRMPLGTRIAPAPSLATWTVAKSPSLVEKEAGMKRRYYLPHRGVRERWGSVLSCNS